MPRDPRYDILFEPVRIGPVTAKNRFYQVPHCTGMGWQRPRTLAAMRGIKAEGGWGVVCTEYCSIHPSSDDLSFPYASLWDDEDTKANALMAEAVQAQGALAGVELWYGGGRATNSFSRETAFDVVSRPNGGGNPYQSRAMDKADIKTLRRWHRDAALRAKTAGFDIVYVYATHGYLLSHFLSPTFNTRTDEYGGSLENRARLVREIIEETKDAVGDRCAVAVRFSVEDGGGADGAPVHGEQRAIFETLADLPDLWDLTMADYSYEMGVSRFVKEGALEPYMAFARTVTSKPVVTVGRFTSPDSMVGQVRRGLVDFIGAARPSIADPFLPRKIEEGRLGEIRECIGCNICYAGDGLGVPIRCTQNPTMGEEWRRGWHPEVIAPKGSEAKVLIVGAGPAGLEATRALGQRGYEVILAEAATALGGRVTREAALPGLGEWARVRDYRVQQIQGMANVEVYLESDLRAADVLEVGADHVAIATGADWRRDGFGRSHPQGLTALGPQEHLFTPDDVMAGRLPGAGESGARVLLYDDDGYYMGAVLAERLVEAGATVTLVTPNSAAAPWSSYTAEQDRTIARLLELGVEIVTGRNLARFDGGEAVLRCVYTEREQRVVADDLLLVTARQPRDGLYHELRAEMAAAPSGAPKSLCRIGDCDAPAIIAAAVYSGHRYARELDQSDAGDRATRRDWMFDAAP